VKWLWRDYPKPIEAGISGNSMLRSVLAPGQSWQPVGGTYTSPADLAVDLTGNVSFYDAKSAIYRIAADGVPRVFAHCSTPVTAQSFGPEGRLYAASSDGKIFAVSPQGKLAVFVRGICADGLYVSSDGVVFATEPGVHEELPSKIWRITPAGSKKLVDQGLHGAAGVVMTPDHNLLFAIEGDTHWIDSYVVQQNGTLADKQRFYWLHTAESADDAGDNSGASAMAEDTQGDLFVATRMGVQICDRNGRVEGILTLPQGAVTSLCFGGQDFHTLYIICGGRIYQRSMKCTGVPNWAKPITLPPFNPG
jgi:sugar lactone lactonase YvrE